MTDYEFTQIMRDAGYEVTANSATIWKYKKLPDCFCLEENKKKDSGLGTVMSIAYQFTRLNKNE